MGLEAQCSVRLDGETAVAKALLESKELILRVPFRKSFPIADLKDVRVEGEELRFAASGSRVALTLGAATAAKWAKKIATPAPSLAAKLGIGHASPAHVIGAIDDDALIEALDQHSAPASEAALSLAIVTDAAALDAALAAHEALPAGAHIWIVNVKGSKSPFSDNAIRERMRAIGYKDNKTSGVSDRYSATRYARR